MRLHLAAIFTHYDGLESLTTLQDLWLRHEKNDGALTDAVTALSNLTLLQLWGFSSIPSLASLCRLRRLHVYDGGQVAERLRLPSSLIQLQIRCGWFARAELAAAMAGCPKLQHLHLKRCSFVRRDALDGLSALTALTRLDIERSDFISYKMVESTHFEALRALTGLQHLQLSLWSGLSNLDAVSALCRLTHLELDGLLSVSAVTVRLPRTPTLSVVRLLNSGDISVVL